MSDGFDFSKYNDMLSGFNQMSMMLYEYHLALKVAGFSDQNAIFLVGKWQDNILDNATKLVENKDE